MTPEELDALLDAATLEVATWPEWMLRKSGFDRVLAGEVVVVQRDD